MNPARRRMGRGAVGAVVGKHKGFLLEISGSAMRAGTWPGDAAQEVMITRIQSAT